MFSSNTSAVSGDAVYIEDVFSTWLYTGNGSTQTITNGIDVTGKGGLIWFKERASQGFDHALVDTARGNLSSTEGYSLASNQTAAQSSVRAVPTSSGFSLSSGSGAGPVNFNGSTYVSWTFRKQPKFFDVVTYTGNASSNQTISHNLGSAPGFIIVKCTSSSGTYWICYHRSLGNNYSIFLNTTDAAFDNGINVWGVTSTTFNANNNYNSINANGQTYVAYLFAHNAGGFGLTGTDNVISCGSYTGTGAAGNTIALGYEPQWVMIKSATTGGTYWGMWDSMRGIVTGGSDPELYANSSAAENGVWGNLNWLDLTATGFTPDPTGSGYGDVNENGTTYIYIAIRRGPMKTPTTGTSVFAPYVTSSLNNLYNAGFVTDWVLQRYAANTDGWYTGPRLIGKYYMKTETTAAELFSAAANWDSNTGAWNFNANYGLYMFRRAPGFFDVVCYTGDATARTISHNLGVAPEMMIVKARSSNIDWSVYVQPLGADQQLFLNLSSAQDGTNTVWNNTAPTSSVFSIGTSFRTNTNNATYIAYLFASCPGVSKVGTYTGTGNTLQINCGFTGGARFVLIKRTDSNGDWYVWDSARGIVAGNDPYLLLNSTAAEVTNTDWIDTHSAGFEISNTAPAAINANGGSFIFLAIA